MMKKGLSICKWTILIVFLVLTSTQFVAAEPGVTKTTIKVGSNMILTGPIAFWGQGSDKAARAYFNQVNEQGGIHGRKVVFINTDSGYKPVRAVAATKKMIEKDEVFVLMGYMGSAIILASEKVFGEAGVPLIGPISTGKALVEPPRKYLFNVLTGYEEQGIVILDFLAKDPRWKNMKIAAIYQDDQFGRDGMDAFEAATKRHSGMKIIAKELSVRGNKDFSSQVLKCKNSGADSLFIQVPTTQTAMIVKEAEKIAWKPKFMVFSATVDEKVIELAGSASEGLIGATHTILPSDKNDPVVKKLTQLVHKYYPDQVINAPVADGVAMAMITAEAIKMAGSDPTREKVIKALENMKGYKTGILPPVSFGPNQRQGCTHAFLYQVENGRFVLKN
ncbi:ABC transporter substrate-binding protein [Thermodesulfobacteriota bacterium]